MTLFGYWNLLSNCYWSYKEHGQDLGEIQEVYIRKDVKSPTLFGEEGAGMERVDSSNIGEYNDIRKD